MSLWPILCNVKVVNEALAALEEFGYGARLTEITLLGVLAVRRGKKMARDAAQMQVPGLPAADEIIRGDYRKGWEVA